MTAAFQRQILEGTRYRKAVMPHGCAQVDGIRFHRLYYEACTEELSKEAS